MLIFPNSRGEVEILSGEESYLDFGAIMEELTERPLMLWCLLR